MTKYHPRMTELQLYLDSELDPYYLVQLNNTITDLLASAASKTREKVEKKLIGLLNIIDKYTK